MTIESIKSKEDGTHVVAADDLFPSVNNAGDEAFGVTLNQILASVLEKIGGLNTVVLDIGDWDMDSDSLVTLNHELDEDKIQSISVLIRADNGSGKNDIHNEGSSPGTGLSGFGTTPTTISLYRKTGGVFDDLSHASTGFNRGWITIHYTD